MPTITEYVPPRKGNGEIKPKADGGDVERMWNGDSDAPFAIIAPGAFAPGPHLYASMNATESPDGEDCSLITPAVKKAFESYAKEVLEPRKAPPKQPKFPLIPFNEIHFVASEEWLVKKLLPRKGVAAFYGGPGSVKSFALLDLNFCVALGWPWAGRRVNQAPAVYIAAEGAGGMPKRIAGWQLHHDGRLPDDIPFSLVKVAPNLGVGDGDLKELIASIEATGIRPGLISIDTLSQSIGTGDENGAGMVQFAANATALANHFGCLVIVVHHVGLGDDQRLRGHTSFLGALDASVLCERKEGEFLATLTVKKLKDEESDQKFTAHLARIVVGKDEGGEDITTLIVESVEVGTVEGDKAPKRAKIPATLRLFMEVLAQTIDEAGESIKPFADGPTLKAAPVESVRSRYYLRRATAKPKADPGKMADANRQAFNRAVEKAIEETLIMAWTRESDREEFVWFK